MGKNLIQQARGKGGPTYRSRSFRFAGRATFPKPIPAKGTVTDIIECPGHSAPLIEVLYETGETCLMQAPTGIKKGDAVETGSTLPNIGNILKLRDIPEGTNIYNIEKAPGDGGRFCRTSGTSAKIVGRTQTEVIVLLPSKKEKTFNMDCRAAIGIISGGGRTEKPILKAGNVVHAMRARNKRYPNPSAAAQNAVDHPFGNKRTSRKAKQKAVNRFAPPGRKVGKLWPKRTGRR
ncbi:50S ribosomal protein L2 [Candidatus Woesearchaeota archaeon]|nr:50S ribosomal protein L2 [Candidatus Woesearchaeota archaeon]